MWRRFTAHMFVTCFALVLDPGTGAVAGQGLAPRRLERLKTAVSEAAMNAIEHGTEAIVAAFAAGLQDAPDLDAVRDDLMDAAQHVVEPAHVSVSLIRT
jgi:hypothetical protein